MDKLEHRLLFHILSHLSIPDLCRFSATNRFFRQFIATTSELYPILFLDDEEHVATQLTELMRTKCLIPVGLGNVARIQLLTRCPSAENDISRLGMAANDSLNDSSYWLQQGRNQDRLIFMNRWLWSKRHELAPLIPPSAKEKLRAKMARIPVGELVSEEMQQVWQNGWERARDIVMSLESVNLSEVLTTFWNEAGKLAEVDEMDTVDMEGLVVEETESISDVSMDTDQVDDGIYDSLFEYPDIPETSIVKRLTHAVELLLANLDQQPSQAPSAYLLAFVAYLCGALETAQELLQVVLGLDDSYPPALELLQELNSTNIEPSEKVPLLDEMGQDLSEEMSQVVEQIFQQLDQDKDGYLSPRMELPAFFRIANPNQDPPPLNILLTMCRNYNQAAAPRRALSQSEVRKGLTLGGLKKFYHVQSGEDGEETRRDLEKFGYNGKTLNK